MQSLADLSSVRAFRAFTTCLELCQDRGYRIARPSWVEKTKVAVEGNTAEEGTTTVVASCSHRTFVQNVMTRVKPEETTSNEEGNDDNDEEMMSAAVVNRDGMGIYAKSTTNPETDRLMVLFVEEDQLSLASVNDCRNRALEKKCRKLIIVVTGRIFPGIKRDVDELSNRIGDEVVKIQLFEEDSLTINITRHDGVATHVPVPATEGVQFLKEKGLLLSQLPRILFSDPIVQYFGLEQGRILRIIRHAEHSGDYHMYRQVI